MAYGLTALVCFCLALCMAQWFCYVMCTKSNMCVSLITLGYSVIDFCTLIFSFCLFSMFDFCLYLKHAPVMRSANLALEFCYHYIVINACQCDISVSPSLAHLTKRL